MRGLLIAAVLLTGCDGSREPVEEPAVAVDSARVQAEKACAAITGYRSGGTDTLLAEEFKACVAAVSDDAVPELRGRTEAPA